MRRAALDRAGPDGAEQVDAVGVRGRAAPAEEIGIVVAPGGARLPDLEDGVVERLAVGLRHAAGDLDRFARRPAAFADREVARAVAEFAREERPEGHRPRWPQRLHGRDAVARRPRTTIWYS